jgi:hypothetical protein
MLVVLTPVPGAKFLHQEPGIAVVEGVAVAFSNRIYTI